MDLDWGWLIGGAIVGGILAYLRVKSSPTIATPRAMGGMR